MKKSFLVSVLCIGLFAISCKTNVQQRTITKKTNSVLETKQKYFAEGFSFYADNTDENTQLFFKPDSILVLKTPDKILLNEKLNLHDMFKEPMENYLVAGGFLQIIDSTLELTKTDKTKAYYYKLQLENKQYTGYGYNLYDTRINGKWRLTHMKGSPINPNQENIPYIEIDGEKNRLSGQISCNRIFGPFQLRGNSIKAGAIASTLMACQDILEFAFLRVFDTPESYRIDDTILTITLKNKDTVQFERMP